MTKRDYVATARELHKVKPYPPHGATGANYSAFAQWEACVLAVGNVFASGSARFDPVKFKDACYNG